MPHQQIRASPDNTASNVRRVVNALAKANVNIESIAPDFEPPHVRIVVQHDEEYDPENAEDPFNQALAALVAADLTPEVRSAVSVTMENKPRALKAALDRLAREGYTVESVLVLPGEPEPGKAEVSFGISRAAIAGWTDQLADELQGRIETDIANLPEPDPPES